MRNSLLAGVAVVALLVGVAAGYRYGTGAWPLASTAMPDATQQRAPARKVLYWKDPVSGTDFSTGPKKTNDGRDYVPVYEEQEPDLDQGRQKPLEIAKNTTRRILYYRNPMGLADTSLVPKKDWMGMDYIPVYEGEEQDTSAVTISLERVQRAGVRTEEARMLRLARPVRVPGIAKPDERTLRVVSLRADGFIEKLLVNSTGQYVTSGEPMFVVYSPQMVSVQVDYRNAMKAPAAERRNEAGALQRLRNLGVPESVIAELQVNPEPRTSITWPAPVTGVVMKKSVVEGQMAKAGEELFRIADLSTIWVIADVAEQDLGQIKIGAPAEVRFRAFPAEVFTGKVTFILHELETATRSAKVRIEIANPGHRLKHEMFADVVIDAGAGDQERLAVPVSAVIDSGNRQVVLVERGEGRFEPRAVKLGLRGDGLIEITDGLKDRERVVVAANFLIDAESNLKAALQAFTAPPAKEKAKP